MKTTPLLIMILFVIGPSAFAQGPPPPLPAVFDQATVSDLLAHIDQGQNATVLKFGYFIRRGAPGMDRTEGYGLLTDAIKQEQVGSKRWLLLETVRGFAGPRVSEQTRADGYVAYGEILDHWQDAQKAHNQDILVRAIYELIATLPGQFGTYAGPTPGSDPASSLLDKAFRVYLKVMDSEENTRYEIQWSRVASQDNRLPKLMDAAVADPAEPKTYTLYKTAAEIYQQTDPAKAAAYLVKAEPLVVGNAVRTEALYTELVDMLLQIKEIDHAVAAQKQLIAATGVGHARLATIYYDNKNQTDYKAEIALLEKPGADEEDVVELSSAFAARTVGDTDPVYVADPTALLTAYLARTTPRSVQWEMQARYTLAGLYIQGHQTDKALALIQGAKAPPDTAPHIALLAYNALMRMKDQIPPHPGGSPQ